MDLPPKGALHVLLLIDNLGTIVGPQSVKFTPDTANSPVTIEDASINFLNQKLINTLCIFTKGINNSTIAIEDSGVDFIKLTLTFLWE